MVRTGALCEGAWEGSEQAHRSHSRREGFCGAGSTQKALYKARLTPGWGGRGGAVGEAQGTASWGQQGEERRQEPCRDL